MCGIVATILALPLGLACCGGAGLSLPFLTGAESWLAGGDALSVTFMALLVLLAFLIVKRPAARIRRHERSFERNRTVSWNE